MRKGNWRSKATSTGSRQASLVRSVAATICRCVTSSDRIDMVNAFGRVLIALVHAVHPQIAGPVLRIGSPQLADAHCGGLRLVVGKSAFAIALLVAQVVQMSHHPEFEQRIRRPNI